MNFGYGSLDEFDNINFYMEGVVPSIVRHERVRRVRMPLVIALLSDGSCSEIIKYEDVEIGREQLVCCCKSTLTKSSTSFFYYLKLPLSKFFLSQPPSALFLGQVRFF